MGLQFPRSFHRLRCALRLVPTGAIHLETRRVRYTQSMLRCRSPRLNYRAFPLLITVTPRTSEPAIDH